MDIIRVYIILLVIGIIIYGIPLVLIKGKWKVLLSLGVGCGLFYLLSGIYILFMNFFNLDNGNYPFFEDVALAFFIGLPFMIIANLVLAIIYYLLSIFVLKNKE